MLKKLEVRNVGPVPHLDVEFAERLNVLTGDNGLGKTFLLDVAWWSMTETWANQPAWPDPRYEGPATIRFQVGGESGKPDRFIKGIFDPTTQTWPRTEDVAPPGLVIYCQVDGGFSVCDPRKRRYRSVPVAKDLPRHVPFTYNFSQQDLWNGVVEWETELSTTRLGRDLPRSSQVLCNGLIRDWTDWRSGSTQDKKAAYQSLTKVLEALSPDPESEKIVPGEPMRVALDDVREIPTIDLPYGNVPVIYASAGMKRILSLAYVLVWTWYEHQQSCKILKQEPSGSLILLIDELDAHLHPKWQRSIVQALLAVAKILSDKIKTQIIATTHSPLILASMEPWFDEGTDSVFVFEEEQGRVTLSPFTWGKYGDVASWLTSPVFGLHRGRSKEAEYALEAAYAFMRGDNMERFGRLRDRESIDEELKRVLSDADPFLMGWDYQMKKQREESERHDSL
jgi:hypothetical protein